MMARTAGFWLSAAWGLSIVAAWMFLASAANAPLEPSDLMALGAVRGIDMALAEPWRLLAAQWLHIDPARMLFNAGMIALLGGALASKSSSGAMLFVGLAGGAVGLFAGSIAYPDLVLFGATQALLAICGAVAVVFMRPHPVWCVAVLTVLGSVAFDLLSGSQGALQLGFAFGVLTGWVLLLTGNLRRG